MGLIRIAEVRPSVRDVGAPWWRRPMAAVAIVATALVLAGLGTGQPLWALPLLVAPVAFRFLQRSPRDAVTVLTGFLVLLFVVPANLIVGPLGSAGRPAMLYGLACAWWWAHDRLLPDGGTDRGFQPVRVAVALLLAAALASYVAAFSRPIDGLEARAADRGLLGLLGLLGVVVLAADGIGSRARLDQLLRRLVLAGAFLAALGILQFAGVDLSGLFRLPLLVEHADFQQVQLRSDLRRVASTAAHPIEFGVVLGLVLPLALHDAMHRSGAALRRWLPTGLIAVAIPMSVSRSATIAAAITTTGMWLTWSRRQRLIGAVVTGVLLLAMRFAVPGLLGTIRSLFTNMGTDNSVAGRTEDYVVVGRYVSERPLLGRGHATFIPERYVLLDNQFLGTLIEMGVVGVTALVVLFLVGWGTARGARRGADAETRSLGQAIASAVLAAAVAAGTFDLLGFGMVAGVTGLLIGCAGALWRLERRDRDAVPPDLLGTVR